MSYKVAYCVRQITKDKSVWTPIGRVFPHKDGKGEDVVLNALPIPTQDSHGIKVKIVLRVNTQNEDSAEGDIPF